MEEYPSPHDLADHHDYVLSHEEPHTESHFTRVDSLDHDSPPSIQDVLHLGKHEPKYTLLYEHMYPVSEPTEVGMEGHPSESLHVDSSEADDSHQKDFAKHLDEHHVYHPFHQEH